MPPSKQHRTNRRRREKEVKRREKVLSGRIERDGK